MLMRHLENINFWQAVMTIIMNSKLLNTNCQEHSNDFIGFLCQFMLGSSNSPEIIWQVLHAYRISEIRLYDLYTKQAYFDL